MDLFTLLDNFITRILRKPESKCVQVGFKLEPEPVKCLRLALHEAEIYIADDWSAIRTKQGFSKYKNFIFKEFYI